LDKALTALAGLILQVNNRLGVVVGLVAEAAVSKTVAVVFMAAAGDGHFSPPVLGLAAAELSASFGPAQPVVSRQQTQVISNAKLFWNLERHRAVSSACSEHLACHSRCANDWYGYGWR
jgi:hypothetical protein